MVDGIDNLGGLGGLGGPSSASGAAGSKDVVDKTEFLQLLVTQLKNQDPLNPMDNQRFSVDLATFSQLEQLISINDKLDQQSSPASDAASLASYLGYQVTLDTDLVQLNSGNAGQVRFDLPEDASSVTIQLLDSQGAVVSEKQLEATSAGKHFVDLDGFDAPNGIYQMKVIATGSQGTTMNPQAFAAGIVTGFVPGPEPVLVVNGQEVYPASIREVSTAA